MLNKKLNLGRKNVRISRLRAYYGIFTLIQVTIISIVTIHNVWYIIGIIATFVLFTPVIWIIDKKKIFPEEIEYNLTSSKSFVKLCSDVKEIKEYVENNKKKSNQEIKENIANKN